MHSDLPSSYAPDVNLKAIQYHINYEVWSMQQYSLANFYVHLCSTKKQFLSLMLRYKSKKFTRPVRFTGAHSKITALEWNLYLHPGEFAEQMNRS